MYDTMRLMQIAETSTVVAVPNQISSSLGEEAVILELTQGVYYGLNAVGARIWELLKEPRTAGEIRDVILDEYDAEPEAVTRDLLGLLTDLADRGLIEVRDGKVP
jgi:Coenzyme PQQ synthesis protein D (PqqD)